MGGFVLEQRLNLDLSCVVITLNEERHLERCLRSLPDGAEVLVLDSGSTDQTEQIALRCGALFSTRPFTNHADQKNAAIALATRGFVFSIDADEEATPELRAQIEAVVASGDKAAPGYRVRRRLFFMGRRMRFGKTTDAPLRLWKRGAGRFEASIHEHFVLSGGASAARLEGELLHVSYDDLSDYFKRFNFYTSRIAEEHRRGGRRMPPFVAHVLRPWGEFVSRYFLRLGFLDGYPGYCYALLSSLYAFVKYAKLRELETAAK